MIKKGTTFIPQIPEGTPLFVKTLVYQESGHTLTNLRDYYVCSEKQKGCCKNPNEKSFSIKNFERKFCRHMDDLRIEESIGKKLYYELQRKNIDLKEIYDNKLDEQQDNMQTVINAVKKDIENGEKIKKSDIYCFNDYYKSTLKIDFIFFIALMCGVTVNAFGRPDLTNADIARQFMTFTKKIFVTNTGDIISIELEGIGDYIFSLLQSKIPSFLNNFKIPLIGRKKFQTLDLVGAIKNFEADGFRNVHSFHMFANQYEEDKQIKSLFKFMKGAKPKEIIETLIMLKYTSKTLGALVGVFMFSKNNNKVMFKKMSESKKGRKNSKYSAIVFK